MVPAHSNMMGYSETPGTLVRGRASQTDEALCSSVHFRALPLWRLMLTTALLVACGSESPEEEPALAPEDLGQMPDAPSPGSVTAGATNSAAPSGSNANDPSTSPSANGGAPDATPIPVQPGPEQPEAPDPGMDGGPSTPPSDTASGEQTSPGTSTAPTGTQVPTDPEPTDPQSTDPQPEPAGGSQCEGGTPVPGFYVEEGRIFDNHCSEFDLRGVNYPYAWYKDSQDTEQIFHDIAATGANSVRVVLATGGQWTRVTGSEISSIIGWTKANKLVAILEVHDSTGYAEKAEAVHPDDAVEYWLSEDVKAAIVGQEAYVMINIANEPFGNDATDQWEPFHTGAVAALRTGGLEHLLIVDAPNWGQDWSNTMRDGMGASNIFAADPAKNTVFSVHMYDVYNTSELVWTYFESFLGSGMALMVGEFAADHGPGKDVDEDAILAASKEHRIGYLGWSWSGNSSDLTSLDVVEDFNASVFSSWGQRLIDGADGIRETSRLCRCYE